jgi:hypothetical protein
MNSKLNILVLFFIVFLCVAFSGTHLNAQKLSGYIQNETNEPIPYVNILVRELGTGTTTNEQGYYSMNIEPGEYEVIYSVLGFATKSIQIVVKEDLIQKNLWMTSSAIKLDQVVVKASKKDPAYAIIKHAIDAKPKYLKQVDSYRTKIYIKATEEIDKKEKKKKKRAKKEEKKIDVEADAPGVDPFLEAEKAKLEAISGISLIESEVTLNYKYPKKYKEERTAYKLYGDKDGLFIPRFGESDFDFYRNLVFIPEISEVPIISPLKRTSILSYRFKLIETKTENGLLVHKIKVTPRKKGNATCKGYIYINDGLWNINRLDLNFSKGGLKFFDAFRLKQNFEQLSDSTWFPYRVEFIYSTKQGKYKTFKGNTLLRYSEYETNYPFPPKFFGNEISVTTQEAYERDTSYWKSARPEPLTIREQKLVAYKDSVYAVVNSIAYKDSMQALYNKVTLLDLLIEGVGFRNHAEKESIYFGPIPSLIDFAVVGGLRVGLPTTSVFKRWPKNKWINLFGSLNFGLKNKDLQGYLSADFRYNPRRLGDVSIFGGRDFEAINNFDAYLNQLRNSNFYLRDYLGFGHRIELFNGFYVKSIFSMNDRQSTARYNTESFISRVIEDEEPSMFEPYKAFISKISIAYTPRQKFMSEPNRKIVLGSKWPTFTFEHQRGWNGLFGSDINFDFLNLKMEQNIQFSHFGLSKYTIQLGKFVNFKEVRFIDLKRFRESDDWFLYSDPLNSFQLLDTALATTSLFFEAHYLHHFNGALINNVPLVRALKVHVVAGGGFLWVAESKVRHEEIFAGLERTFKLGPRRRLRLGVYGVAANSNISGPAAGYKISIDILDIQQRNWNF